jgi:hypothetical protein
MADPNNEVPFHGFGDAEFEEDDFNDPIADWEGDDYESDWDQEDDTDETAGGYL